MFYSVLITNCKTRMYKNDPTADSNADNSKQPDGLSNADIPF